MTDAPYTPPKVWVFDKENGGRFASVNRPTAGATHEKILPVGKHPFQLYSRERRTARRSRSYSRSCSRSATAARNTMRG